MHGMVDRASERGPCSQREIKRKGRGQKRKTTTRESLILSYLLVALFNNPWPTTSPLKTRAKNTHNLLQYRGKRRAQFPRGGAAHLTKKITTSVRQKKTSG